MSSIGFISFMSICQMDSESTWGLGIATTLSTLLMGTFVSNFRYSAFAVCASAASNNK
jgi:hypothetical protein